MYYSRAHTGHARRRGEQFLLMLHLLMTDFAGMDGTIRLFSEHEAALTARFNSSLIEGIRAMCQLLQQDCTDLLDTLQREDCLQSFYSCSTNGFLNSLWTFAAALDCGVEVDYTSIALAQETIEICDYLDYNPYTISSNGCSLIATEDCKRISDMLIERGVRVTAIGHATSSNDRVLVRDGRKTYLKKSDH
jgi:hydrogenase maturation factor